MLRGLSKGGGHYLAVLEVGFPIRGGTLPGSAWGSMGRGHSLSDSLVVSTGGGGGVTIWQCRRGRHPIKQDLIWQRLGSIAGGGHYS